MPLQNRVDPWGHIHAVKARGAFLGNRGILHNDSKQIIRSHQHQAWVTCLLAFKNRKRNLMSPGTYTELFFLDEATAFAAGHRPCGECRRERYQEFKDLWVKANLDQPAKQVRVSEINTFMHKERVHRGRKVTCTYTFDKLPIGCMFARGEAVYLKSQGGVFQWSFNGYNPLRQFDVTDKVSVLTPQSVIKVFELGFTPQIHESACF